MPKNHHKNMPKKSNCAGQGANGGALPKWNEHSPAGKKLKKLVKDGTIKEGMPPNVAYNMDDLSKPYLLRAFHEALSRAHAGKPGNTNKTLYGTSVGICK